jgi:antagonist of KipI
MKSILVQAPGLFTTVQDLGREGFGPMGVSCSGAADRIALGLGNRLVGNPANTAALEMTLLGGTFLFSEDAVLALTGSDFGATLDHVPIDLWTSFEARPGQALRLGPTRSGARGYLCVQGGIAVELFLGSASTHILSGLGGFEGRALRKGDVLSIANASHPYRRRTVAPDILLRLSPRKILRCTPGPQSDRFPESSQRIFYDNIFLVSEESNRMGLRLEGPSIPASSGVPVITEGVSLGAIQVPNGGSPIILFVEQQTTGGYPKIGNVISADMSSVGQLRPRDNIHFERVSFASARSLLQQQEELLTSPELIQE